MARRPVELTINVPWGHIAALAWGDSRSQPVLMVHGLTDNADSFTRLIQLLPQHYYYVAIDLPGHGLSSHFPDGVQLDFVHFTSAIYFVLEKLKWEKCYYIGHSHGGATGVVSDAIIRGRFQKIVAIDLISGYMFSPRETAARFKTICDVTFEAATNKGPLLYTKEEIVDTLEKRRPFRLKREAAEVMFERGTTRVGDRYKLNRDERVKTHIMPCWNFEQYASFYREGKAPVLFIVAKESWYHLVRQPRTVDLIKKNFSDRITIVHVEGNHDVHNNNPEVIAPLIAKFFSDNNSKL